MGIIVNAVGIVLGGLIGSFFKKKDFKKYNAIFGFCVIIISIVGFFENIYSVTGSVIKSENLLVVIFAFIVGYFVGDFFKMEEVVTSRKINSNGNLSCFIDASLFFAIGGLQISGSMLLAIKGDSSLLFIKTLIDVPFSIMFGSLFGKSVIWSAIPVAVLQIVIFLATLLIGDYVSNACLSELSAISYVILFFSGYNMLVENQSKIKNINMLPSVLLIILYNIIVGFVR